MSASPILDFSIDPEFDPYIPAALLRLGYIYPELGFSVSDKGISVHGVPGFDPAQIEREVTYQIYREKIFRQTLPMRQKLYAMMAG